MLSYFAGPVRIELPLSIVIGFYLLVFGGFLGIGLLLFASTRFSLRVRSQNLAIQKTKATGTFRLNNYVAGILIDAVTSFSLSYLLGIIGMLGEWNNQVWHTTLIIATATFFFIRLISRIVVKASPGEKLLHSRYSLISCFLASLGDLIISYTIYLVVSSL
ncbi:MAG TPA: hypothetical protein VM124_02590 [Candidatus Limnocylindrales bacterium]|nr:hypothetical protein [Candidatus Limnocylindrales bacterium]